MSARQSATSTSVAPALSPPSPNASVASITVDLRVFWPARAGNTAATLGALEQAYNDVRTQILTAEDTSTHPAASTPTTKDHR